MLIIPQGERYAGKVMRGRVWDRLLREYYYERVFVDIALERVAAWPDLSAAGHREVTGATWPEPAGPQRPPKNGTGPRVDVAKAAARIAMLPHRVLAYQGADGFPVVVPVQLAGHDNAGLRLAVAGGLLPPGGRRAGLLAHGYRPQLVGLNPDLHRLAGRHQRRSRGLRTAHLQGLHRTSQQDPAAGIERAIRQVRHVAGPAPAHRRAPRAADGRDGRHRCRQGLTHRTHIDADRAITGHVSEAPNSAHGGEPRLTLVQTRATEQPNLRASASRAPKVYCRAERRLS